MRASLTHEERIVSRVRDVYCNRCTMEWGAQTCGISLEEFKGYYNQYIQRLCYAIQHKQEWFLCSELQFLLLFGYMRPNEAAKRYRTSEENIEKYIEQQGGINKNLSWRDMRLLRVKQKEEAEEQKEAEKCKITKKQNR